MSTEQDIMKYEQVLPENFNGVFYFTNWSDEDFVGVWNSKQYSFPKKSTSPMIIPEHSPVEIQNIRKKFAKNLAEREFYKSKEYGRLMSQERNPDGSPRLNSLHQGGTYSMNELAPYIQKCLEPLPMSHVVVTDVPKENVEDKLSRNEDGELNTTAIDRKTSLTQKALGAK